MQQEPLYFLVPSLTGILNKPFTCERKFHKNFITIWYHSCKRGHGKDETSARSWYTEQRDAVHVPILLNPSEVKHLSCRVLEHLCLREQPRLPSRSGVSTQVGCVLPSLHCASAQPQVEALCWRAGQTGEVSHHPVCSTFIRGHSFNPLPLLCKDARKERPSASLTKQECRQHVDLLFLPLSSHPSTKRKHQQLHNAVQIKLQI